MLAAVLRQVTTTLAAEGKTIGALACPSEDEALVYAGCDTQAYRERHHATIASRGTIIKPLRREETLCLSEVGKSCNKGLSIYMKPAGFLQSPCLD